MSGLLGLSRRPACVAALALLAVLAGGCGPAPGSGAARARIPVGAPSGGTADGAAAPSAPVKPGASQPGQQTVTSSDRQGVPLPDLRHRSARLGDVQRRTRAAAPARVPVRVRVPAIDVDATVAAVGVDASGQMAVPPDGATTAWYRHGPSPGNAGSAVVAGHVDYAGEPGVFFRLRELGDGDRVVVDYDDGSRHEFTVRESRSYTKASLPVDEIFARTGRPVVTLITCGGPFDASSRHYRDNLVVRATPSG